MGTEDRKANDVILALKMSSDIRIFLVLIIKKKKNFPVCHSNKEMA